MGQEEYRYSKGSLQISTTDIYENAFARLNSELLRMAMQTSASANLHFVSVQEALEAIRNRSFPSYQEIEDFMNREDGFNIAAEKELQEAERLDIEASSNQFKHN